MLVLEKILNTSLMQFDVSDILLIVVVLSIAVLLINSGGGGGRRKPVLVRY